MNSFTALDFETATGYRNSICQVGFVRVENGIITKEVNILVQPPDNYYWSRFTELPQRHCECTHFRPSLASNHTFYRKSKCSGS